MRLCSSSGSLLIALLLVLLSRSDAYGFGNSYISASGGSNPVFEKEGETAKVHFITEVSATIFGREYNVAREEFGPDCTPLGTAGKGDTYITAGFKFFGENKLSFSRYGISGSRSFGPYSFPSPPIKSVILVGPVPLSLSLSGNGSAIFECGVKLDPRIDPNVVNASLFAKAKGDVGLKPSVSAGIPGGFTINLEGEVSLLTLKGEAYLLGYWCRRPKKHEYSISGNAYTLTGKIMLKANLLFKEVGNVTLANWSGFELLPGYKRSGTL